MRLRNENRPKRSFFTSKGMRTGRKESRADIRRGATEVMNYRLLRKIILLAISIIIVILLIGYAFVLIYNRTGRFTVSIQNPDPTFALTLCEHDDFESRSSVLMNDQEVRMTNICGNTLPKNINQIDAEHNGKNYLAYTFYCKNVGTSESSLHYEMTFNNVTNRIDECVRVRLYVTSVVGSHEIHNVNTEYSDFAKTRSDGQGPETHYCDKAFSGNYVVIYDYVNNVEVGDIVKYTVVIWVEGDDQDCNDSVINGSIKFDMQIEAKPPVDKVIN